MFARAALVIFVAIGTSCAGHRLDLEVTLSDTCGAAVPAGGSLLYQLHVAAAADEDGGTGLEEPLCAACLSVINSLADRSDLIAFVRQRAPSCPGVSPGSTVTMHLLGFDDPNCTPSSVPSFCAHSEPLRVPRGAQDDRVAAPLVCDTPCVAQSPPDGG